MAKRKRKHHKRRGSAIGQTMTWQWMIRESSDDFREWLEGLELTRRQRESVCRAVKLARFVARSKGEVISPEEAMGKIAQTWLDHHPAV